MAYADRTDLARLGLRSGALTGVSTGDQDAALEAASDTVDGYLRSRYTLPLSAWGDDLRRAVCTIAAWDILTTRGFDPSKGGDEAIRLRYEDAIKWCEAVSAGRVKVTGGITTPTATRSAKASSPATTSSRIRGW